MPLPNLCTEDPRDYIMKDPVSGKPITVQEYLDRKPKTPEQLELPFEE